MRNLSEAKETVAPDGTRGLYYQERGFGWTYLFYRGERFWAKSRSEPDVFWSGPYGGIYHRLAGWPFYALRSRVEVLDSQAANRIREGQPEREPLAQRRRWQLPWSEILQRGIATQDLPAWIHAQPGRRVPLIPMPLGFFLNALIFGTAYSMAAAALAALRIRFTAGQTAPASSHSPVGQRPSDTDPDLARGFVGGSGGLPHVRTVPSGELLQILARRVCVGRAG